MAPASTLFIFLIFASTTAQKVGAAQQPVTFGSAIALVHEASGHKLYSGKISWGSSSAGQAVTAQPASEASSSSMWQVRPVVNPIVAPFDPSSSSSVSASSLGFGVGVPVACGSRVVLQHVNSQAALRAGQAEAPLSPNYEVGASSGAEGPESVFVVECTKDGDVWRSGVPVKLRNAFLDSNLQASQQHMFTYNNCGRGCPIASHLEVSVVKSRPSSWSWNKPADSWVAQPQLLFLAEGEAAEASARDEL